MCRSKQPNQLCLSTEIKESKFHQVFHLVVVVIWLIDAKNHHYRTNMAFDKVLEVIKRQILLTCDNVHEEVDRLWVIV